ncbi:thioesterase family protein [Actinophytocola sp.]|uniref:acyl-CoA thioesterase n=1 Tax=Actinophytocola sp. TaxID=1872138 RepID=UPI002ED1A0C8
MTRHLYRCPLRWADMDVYGIVNNVMYLRLLEEARVDFIFRMAPTDGDAFFRDGSVVVRNEIDYLDRLTHRHEPVDIELWVSDLRSATVTVSYEVRDGDRLCARASTVMAPFDYRKNRPRRLTDAEVGFFEKYREVG